jgi:hypothetical protein
MPTIRHGLTLIAAWMENSPRLRWALPLMVCGVFTLMLVPEQHLAPRHYRVGDVAERDVKASQDFLVEDIEATESSRRQAADGSLTVYDYHGKLLAETARRVQGAFATLRGVTEHGPDHPREASAAAAQHERVWSQKNEFEAAIGFAVSNSAYALLERDNFSRELADLVVRLLTEILENGVVDNKEALLRESDRGIVLRDLGDGSEEVVRSLKRYYSLEQARAMVRVIGQPMLKELNANLRNLVVDLSQSLLQPNITLNRAETASRRTRTVEQVRPVLLRVKAGEMLLREGERVTAIQLARLKALRAQSNQVRAWSRPVGAGLLLFSLLAIIYLFHIQRRPNLLPNINRHLLFLSTLTIIACVMATAANLLAEAMALRTTLVVASEAMRYAAPMAAAAMIVSLLLGLDTAIAVALVISAGTALIYNGRLEVMLYVLVGSVMGSYWLHSGRERRTFVRTGLRLGLLNAAMAGVGMLFVGTVNLARLPWDLGFALLSGVLSGIVTAGVVPLVEMAFGYTTDTTLMELANLDQPLLRRLMLQAPGTYHHSVLVGTLVEAAAAEIGANPLLAKVCGYYHDIGKTQKPLYFIENQTDGKNRHDKLAPSMSKRVLAAHVRHGVEIARAHKLGQAIIDAIQQHHGTSVMSYFFEKAKQLKGDDSVNADDYRYPGPLPQTREAGLVMLADIVEAASRTLENPTPARIQGLVQRLINKVFSDGQLDHCELTLRDLNRIAKSFNKILNAIHHHRIEYSESPTAQAGKERDGGTDRQPSKSLQSLPGRPAAQRSSHLKRLGMS